MKKRGVFLYCYRNFMEWNNS